MNVFHEPLIQAFALAVCAVVLTLIGLGFETARLRAKRKIVVNPEDVAVAAGAIIADVEHADVQRLQRAHRNALESAVPFFALGTLYVLTAPGLTFARLLFGVFVVARVLHAVFYARARQPYRTGVFAVGALVNLTMMVQIVRVAIAG